MHHVLYYVLYCVMHHILLRAMHHAIHLVMHHVMHHRFIIDSEFNCYSLCKPFIPCSEYAIWRGVAAWDSKGPHSGCPKVFCEAQESGEKSREKQPKKGLTWSGTALWLLLALARWCGGLAERGECWGMTLELDWTWESLFRLDRLCGRVGQSILGGKHWVWRP